MMKKSALVVFNQLSRSNIAQFFGSTRAVLLAGFLIISFLILLSRVAEYLWFEALGYSQVFWLIWVLKLSLFLATFVLAFVYFWINLRLLFTRIDVYSFITGSPASAGKFSGPQSSSTPPRGLAAFIACVIALIFGSALTKKWDTLLRFQWSQSYAEVDPIYAQDIGFYLFRLPLLELMQNTVAAVIFITLLLLLMTYFWVSALTISWSKGLQTTPRIHRHITVNVAFYLLVLAWGYYLDRYELLQSSDGAVYGAGYTDVYITRPVLWIALGGTSVLGFGHAVSIEIYEWKPNKNAIGNLFGGAVYRPRAESLGGAKFLGRAKRIRIGAAIFTS